MSAKKPSPDADWARFRNTPVPGVTLMHAHFSEHSFEKHSHDTFSIGQTHAGIQAFRCRGEDLCSVKGKIVAFNPDEAHDGHRGGSEAFEYVMLYIEPNRIFDALRDFGHRHGRCHIVRPLIDDPVAWLSLNDAIAALQHPNESLRADALLTNAISLLFRRHGDAMPVTGAEHKIPQWISRARDYIEEHYASDITVDDLARVVQVSRVHVTRAFAAAYGVSPHVYLNSVRIKNAKGFLLAGQSAADVAALTGFADQSHFTRRFKGSIGLTPAAWLRDMQQGGWGQAS
jgi:AraC-like DNA-binding protein